MASLPVPECNCFVSTLPPLAGCSPGPLCSLHKASLSGHRPWYTVFTRGDVAALPVGGPGPPGAEVLGHCLVGAGVHALHAPGLEAVVAAGRRAQGPQADPPVYAAGFGPAVLGAHGPVVGGWQD